MYIFKNAFKSISRNKGRSVLIGIIVLVISIACSVALAINNTASDLIDSYASTYETEAKISFNRQAMMGEFDPSDETSRESMREQFSSIESVTLDEVEEYATSEYVSDYYYTYEIGMNSDELEAAESTDMSFNMGPEREEVSTTDFSVIGYSSYDAMSEFIEGAYTMTSGSLSSDFESDTCVINSELASINEIEVGDTITLVNDDISYELEVTGIFEEISSEEDSMSMYSGSVNSIITNTTVINNILELDSDLEGNVTPTFILESEDQVEDFESDLYNMGMSEYFEVTTNMDEIESATSGISSVASFATTFLVTTLIIGAIILLVINMINVRERKYEIGVLRTIGMKKSKLTSQFLVELVSVAVVALMLGALIGSFISVPVSNNLLESEIASSEEQADEISNNFGGMDRNKDFGNMNGVVTVQAYDSIDAAVDLEVLSQLLLIGIALTFVSSLSAISSIQKFSPLTILKERS